MRLSQSNYLIFMAGFVPVVTLLQLNEIHHNTKDCNVDKVIDAIGNRPLRTHIRGLLEILDMQYLGDRDFVPRTTPLTELSTTEDTS